MPASAVVVDHCPRLLAHAHRRHLRLLLELLLRLRLHWSRWRVTGGLLCVDDSRWNLHLHRLGIRKGCRLRNRLLLTILYRV